MKETNFYKTGKINDYLSMKRNGGERKDCGAADKNKGNSDKAGQLR